MVLLPYLVLLSIIQWVLFLIVKYYKQMNQHLNNSINIIQKCYTVKPALAATSI